MHFVLYLPLSSRRHAATMKKITENTRRQKNRLTFVVLKTDRHVRRDAVRVASYVEFGPKNSISCSRKLAFHTCMLSKFHNEITVVQRQSLNSSTRDRFIGFIFIGKLPVACQNGYVTESQYIIHSTSIRIDQMKKHHHHCFSIVLARNIYVSTFYIHCIQFFTNETSLMC